MKKIPNKYLILFMTAIVLLTFSAVNGARAALEIRSGEYDAEFNMYHIGVTLLQGENKKEVAWRNYDKEEETWITNDDIELFENVQNLRPGFNYTDEFRVRNSGQISEFVRVVITKYWVDAQGNRRTDLNPAYIILEYDEDNWLLDKDYTTDERIVLYYPKALKVGEETENFFKSISLDDEVRDKYSTLPPEPTDDGYHLITYVFTYNGAHIYLSIEADGVQTHNAKDAIRSAWGIELDATDEELSLGD